MFRLLLIEPSVISTNPTFLDDLILLTNPLASIIDPIGGGFDNWFLMVGLRLLLLKRFDSTCCRALRGNLDCISIDVVNWATGLEYYGVFLFLHYIKKIYDSYVAQFSR